MGARLASKGAAASGSAGGRGANRLEGTVPGRTSGCAVVSGLQCFWHKAWSGVPCISGQELAMACEAMSGIAIILPMDVGGIAQA